MRIVTTGTDYDAALAEIDRLMDAEPGTPEGDRLDILATLVEAYEARHHPIDAPDPIAALEYLMEERGLTRADLVPLLGFALSGLGDPQPEVPADPSEMAWRLYRELGVPAEALIKPYKLADRV